MHVMHTHRVRGVRRHNNVRQVFERLLHDGRHILCEVRRELSAVRGLDRDMHDV